MEKRRQLTFFCHSGKKPEVWGMISVFGVIWRQQPQQSDRLSAEPAAPGRRLRAGQGETEERKEECITGDPVIRAEENDVILQALRRLKETDQQIFFLYYYLGEPAAAVAEKTGMKEATVRTRLARGRKRLKRILKEGGYFDV